VKRCLTREATKPDYLNSYFFLAFLVFFAVFFAAFFAFFAMGSSQGVME
jgi:hypothetical protein